MRLLLPETRVPVLKPPGYLALDMAFGVGAGTQLFDKSRYRSHGAITTAVWAAGLHGRCLDFVRATPDYVTIAAAYTQLDFTTEDFSIIARINLDLLPGNSQVLCRGAGNADGWYFYIDATGQIAFTTNQALANQTSRSTAGSILVANWYTVGVSRSGAIARLFRNGVDDTPTPAVHIDPLTSARNATIGVYSNLAAEAYDGKIEFLRVFIGRALVASEHLAWHNALA